MGPTYHTEIYNAQHNDTHTHTHTHTRTQSNGPPKDVYDDGEDLTIQK